MFGSIQITPRPHSNRAMCHVTRLINAADAASQFQNVNDARGNNQMSPTL